MGPALQRIRRCPSLLVLVQTFGGGERPICFVVRVKREFFISGIELCFGFFFSGRRRHTTWTGDWSSDVCSSDLPPAAGGEGAPVREAGPALRFGPGSGAVSGQHPAGHLPPAAGGRAPQPADAAPLPGARSEERRVGKGGRSRCQSYRENDSSVRG